MIDKPFSMAWRDMAHVPRWVILRRQRQQYLAEHSYFVAIYAQQLCSLIGYDEGYEVLWYALLHDIDETITGDIPGPIKRAAFDKERAEEVMKDVLTDKFGAHIVADVTLVSNEVKAIVSVADSIEEICYLMEEMSMGNSNWIRPVIDEAIERLKVRWSKLPADEQVLKDVWAKIAPQIIGGQLAPPILMKDSL
jgi:5'-deoxynucleotidase YfbR-like HD superfamily hydrolase